MTIALDSTYSIGNELSGVGVYSAEILHGLASAHPEEQFYFCYRPHRFLRSLLQSIPANCRRQLLWESRPIRGVNLFHGLNQRLPAARFRRSVCTFHDLFVFTAEYSSQDYRRRFAGQARRAAERSDIIIAVSQFTASQVRDHLGVEESRIRVIPHGVRFPKQLSQKPKENVILHVGAIQKRKNIVRLVRAFEQVPGQWRLVLAGSTGFGAGEILRTIETSPRRENIELLGYVSPSRLEDLYCRARILAFPSLDEGFGMPVLEAMAHGVPVVTSNRSALPEVAGNAAMLVDPLDEEAISESLIVLMEDRRVYEDYVERGLKRARGLGWEQALEATWAVYQKLLD